MYVHLIVLKIYQHVRSGFLVLMLFVLVCVFLFYSLKLSWSEFSGLIPTVIQIYVDYFIKQAVIELVVISEGTKRKAKFKTKHTSKICCDTQNAIWVQLLIVLNY